MNVPEGLEMMFGTSLPSDISYQLKVNLYMSSFVLVDVYPVIKVANRFSTSYTGVRYRQPKHSHTFYLPMEIIHLCFNMPCEL